MSIQLGYLGDPNRAFWLTRSVARAIGVSLSDAMSEGMLTPNDYSDMVTRCRMCPHTDRCERWLAANGAGAARAPDHCANAEMLNSLPSRRTRRA